MSYYIQNIAKSLFTAALIIGMCIDCNAQEICSGNLGDNIFERGDFGSGAAPVLLIDPNIAPGYTYTTSVPSDGFYTICNNTGALNGLYPTWLSVQDNSNDPNGYMMVVNASFSPGDFYEEEVEGLCENTLYEFSADILNLIRIGTPNHIDPNVSFLIDDVVVYSTGDIPKTEQWRQYGFSFITNSTQTSITLTLRNNAPGGGGNDLALDNISFRPCGPSSFIGIESDTTIFLCVDDDPLTVVADIQGPEGEQFAIQWQSSTNAINWSIIEDSINNSITHTDFTPGNYYYRYYSAANEVNILNDKCRIISDAIKLTILPDTYEVLDTVCEGMTYQFGGQQLFASGSYIENFESQYGCDSTVLLDLFFISAKPVEVDLNLLDPSCFGFEDGSISVNNVVGGNGDLSFSIYDSNDSIIESTVPSGTYFVEVVDKYGCNERFEFLLVDPPEIEVSIGMDTTIKLGDEIILSPQFSTFFESIIWMGMGSFSCENCESPSFVPYYDGLVKVWVEDGNGCRTSDSLFVDVDDQSFLIIPNIFSPNDDNINDFLTINYYGRSVSEIVLFNVYDRWGGLIQSLKNVKPLSGDSIWNGYFGTKRVSVGVYTYRLKVRLINGVEIDRVGSVTVIR